MPSRFLNPHDVAVEGIKATGALQIFHVSSMTEVDAGKRTNGARIIGCAGDFVDPLVEHVGSNSGSHFGNVYRDSDQ